MSIEVAEVPVTLVGGMDDTLKPAKQLAEASGTLANENGLLEGQKFEDSHDEFLQMISELKFQNEFLKSQLEDLNSDGLEHKGSHQWTEASGKDSGVSLDLGDLHEKIQALSRELHEEKQTRVAAEEALKHLRELYTEADARAQELFAKLAEGEIIDLSQG